MLRNVFFASVRQRAGIVYESGGWARGKVRKDARPNAIGHEFGPIQAGTEARDKGRRFGKRAHAHRRRNRIVRGARE